MKVTTPNALPSNKVTADKADTSSASKTSKPPPMPTVHTVYSDKFVKVTTDDAKLTAAQGKALAQKIENAYQFDTKSLGWTETAPLEGKQLEVQALTKAGYDAVLGGDSTGVAGVTMGPNLMAVPENLTQSTNPDDDDTIAHELDHVQDFREAGKYDGRILTYVEEGKAYSIGDMYPAALGEDQKDAVLPKLATALTKWTGADAQDVMAHYRKPADEAKPNGFRNELMGALYVQFLKVHGNGGKGFPDVMDRMSAMVQDIGKGSTYDAAFKKQFGETSKQSEKDFVQFVKDTEGKPTERLAGTIWAQYYQPDTAAPSGNS